jgi:hypothetical protein
MRLEQGEMYTPSASILYMECADDLSVVVSLCLSRQTDEEKNDVLMRSGEPDVPPTHIHAATDTKG